MSTAANFCHPTSPPPHRGWPLDVSRRLIDVNLTYLCYLGIIADINT